MTFPTRHSIARVAVGAALIGVAGMVGCQTSYTVGVKNETAGPITLTVIETRTSGLSDVLASKWLGPGDSATLGPGVSDSSARVELVAESNASTFSPATVQLEPGWTSYDIRQQGSDRLVFVRRDGE